jgi:methionine-R-sulfoxide reductase
MSQEYKKPSAEELKKKLTPSQYNCTQEDGTEPPFQNAFWDNKADGIYVDVVTGEPLFSSLDKFDSGTGWPSFTKPIEDGRVKFKNDGKLGLSRTEVRRCARKPATRTWGTSSMMDHVIKAANATA